MKKPISLLLAAIMICSMLAVFAVPAIAADTVTYIAPDGAEQGVTDYTEITGDTVNWNGVMVASGSVIIDDGVILSGDTQLILQNDASLTVNNGITDGDGDFALTVYAQNNQTGVLTVNGTSFASSRKEYGIDGDNGEAAVAVKTVVFNGGIIMLCGGAGGIGGNGAPAKKDDPELKSGNGGKGGNGGNGIDAVSVTINSTDITITAGAGGKGGNGGAGVNSGYAGNGGKGGIGIAAESLTVKNSNITVTGGEGGNGNVGGAGMALSVYFRNEDEDTGKKYGNRSAGGNGGIGGNGGNAVAAEKISIYGAIVNVTGGNGGKGGAGGNTGSPLGIGILGSMTLYLSAGGKGGNGGNGGNGGDAFCGNVTFETGTLQAFGGNGGNGGNGGRNTEHGATADDNGELGKSGLTGVAFEKEITYGTMPLEIHAGKTAPGSLLSSGDSFADYRYVSLQNVASLPDTDDYQTQGSVFSGGSLTVIVGVAAAVVFGAGGFLLGRRKKKPSTADGAADEKSDKDDK